MTIDALREDAPGPKWLSRWQRSWPAYRDWFIGRGGDSGPSRKDCEAALADHMPELVPIHRQLTELAGGGDREARFLSTWCPPHYLGGCSIAARASADDVRLVRNYDLSPELNEGLLLRSEWSGKPVMGMVEFLWGVSDGINADGLAVALAYGGRSETAQGFGVTTILRYVLETCVTVPEAMEVLHRVPSHMAYNITLADRLGETATVELIPGGGTRILESAIATNHQHGPEVADRPGFTRTVERRDHLEELLRDDLAPADLSAAFLLPPLYQTNHSGGFSTLFTAEYAPLTGGLVLHWPQETWVHDIDAFSEGSRTVRLGGEESYNAAEAFEQLRPYLSEKGARELDRWSVAAGNGSPDWIQLARVFAA